MSETEQIEKAALDARLTLAQVFRTAGVDSSTFYSAKRAGRNMKPVTKARIWDAIRDLSE